MTVEEELAAAKEKIKELESKMNKKSAKDMEKEKSAKDMEKEKIKHGFF